MSRLWTPLVVLALVAAASTPAVTSVCETTRFQVPAGVCARSAVMAVSTDGVLVGGETASIEVDVFLVIDPNGGTCPSVMTASTTVDIVAAGAGVVASGSATPTLIGDPVGAWNRFAVAVDIPGGLTPGVHTLQGSTTITLSSGPALVAGVETMVLVGDGAVVSIDPVGTFYRDAPGNQPTVRFRVENLTSGTLYLDLTATSEQIARRPGGGGTEASGVFSIANPTTGDDFPIEYEPGYCSITLPGAGGYEQSPVPYRWSLSPGETAEVELGVRSFPVCRDGACSQIGLLMVRAGGDTLGLANTAVYVDTQVPPDCRPHLFTELNDHLADSAMTASYFGGTVWDVTDQRWEAIPGGTWTFDSGVGSSFGAVEDLEPGKDPSLHSRMEGWTGVDLTRKSEAPGSGGDFSDIVSLSGLPDPLTPCNCDLTDSVLVFQEPMSGGHPPLQNNLAVSPWVDLASEIGRPGKFVEFQAYVDLPPRAYVFLQVAVQWDGEYNAVTKSVQVSPLTNAGFVYYQGRSRRCTTAGEVYRVDLSHVVPPEATRLRIGLGVVNSSRFWPHALGFSNSSPWIDNVRLGVYGSASEPLVIATLDYDRPQDTFPANTTVSPNAPGRVDAGLIRGALSPEIRTSLGDTLVVRGAKGNAEVYVQFQVVPGPGVNGTGLTQWLAQFTESPPGWYSARMDTAEVGGVPAHGFWMTALHEDDAAFTGTDTDLDPTDVDPHGGQTRLLNDIFPDDLFTGGTRINLFYKARSLAGTTWFVSPDTTGGNYLEWECLPSSFDPAQFWNCVLLVNHSGDVSGTQEALGLHLGTGSANFEGTNWDRYDVRAAGSHQASLGAPLFTEYGASIWQLLTYNCIVYESGDRSGFNLTREDGDLLTPWLTLIDFDFKNLYLSGDNLVSSVGGEAACEPSARRVVEDLAGAMIVCDTYRDAGCPGEKPEDLTACVTLDPVGGAKVAGSLGRSADHVGEGNDCPDLRSFDVLTVNPSPDFGTTVGDEAYATALVGSAPFASVTTDAADVPGTPALNYRIVVDGASIEARRFAGCTETGAVSERMAEVLTFLGHEGASFCSETTSGVGVYEKPPGTGRMELLSARPSPVAGAATAVLSFNLPHRGQAHLAIFDLAGRLVAVPFDGEARAGRNEVRWEARDDRGRTLPGGVYFTRLSAAGETRTGKLIVLGN